MFLTGDRGACPIERQYQVMRAAGGTRRAAEEQYCTVGVLIDPTYRPLTAYMRTVCHVPRRTR